MNVPARSPVYRADAVFSLIWGVAIRLVAVAVPAYLVYRFRFVLVTVLMAAFLALILNPVVDRLCRYRMPVVNARTKRLLFTLLVFLLLFVLVGYSISFLLVPFRTELRRLLDTIDVKHGSLHGYVQNLSLWYQNLQPDVKDFIAGQLDTFGPRLQEMTRAMLQTTLQWLGHILELVTIPVLAFYFVLDSRSLKREFLYLVPRKRSREALLLLREAVGILQTYAIAQLILCLIAGVVVGAGLWALGIRYALTLAVLAGITRAIPILGPIIGGIPIVLIAGLQSVEKGVGVLIFFTMLHIIESKLVMPKLLGDRMNLHPAVLLIVLLAGAELFGILGMFLAAPFAALLKVIFDFYVLSRRRPRRRVIIPLDLPPTLTVAERL